MADDGPDLLMAHSYGKGGTAIYEEDSLCFIDYQILLCIFETHLK